MYNELLETPRRRRDRLYIIAEMLEIAKDGSIKTRIMYRANLSFSQLNQYLDFLLDRKLLKKDMDGRKSIYKTTEKGVKYLERYSEISSLLRNGEMTPEDISMS